MAPTKEQGSAAIKPGKKTDATKKVRKEKKTVEKKTIVRKPRAEFVENIKLGGIKYGSLKRRLLQSVVNPKKKKDLRKPAPKKLTQKKKRKQLKPKEGKKKKEGKEKAGDDKAKTDSKKSVAPKEKKEGAPKKDVKQLTKKRKVKHRKYYPTENRPRKSLLKRRPKKETLKKSLKPGTVAILLAGAHKGKRVIFLKQLDSGLCLITGPHKLNRCPLRRINQIYMIGTKTRVKLTDFKIPDEVNDDFFKREKVKKSKLKKPPVKEEGQTAVVDKATMDRMKARRRAQKVVDKQVMRCVRVHPQRRALCSYLCHKFALSNRQYPHKLKF